MAGGCAQGQVVEQLMRDNRQARQLGGTAVILVGVGFLS